MQEKIVEIEINELGQLHIKPESKKFTMVYRSATEVHWNQFKQTLYSPKPKEWDYVEWFKHILFTIKSNCNIELIISEETNWKNIEEELKEKITKA